MGRASRKTDTAQILQSYRDRGWSEDMIRIFFGGYGSGRGVGYIFDKPSDLVAKLLEGSGTSPRERREILLSARLPIGCTRDDLLRDEVFVNIFDAEWQRVEGLPGDRQDLRTLSARLFADSVLERGSADIIEVSSELSEDVLRAATRRIEEKRGQAALLDWAEEEFGDGEAVMRIVRRGTPASAAYLRAVWGAIQDNLFAEADPVKNYEALCRLAPEAKGLANSEKLLQDSLGDYIKAGALERELRKEEVLDITAPYLQGQLLGLVSGGRRAGDFIGEHFLLGSRSQENPFEGLRSMFRAGGDEKRLGDLYALYHNSAVWPTRSPQRNEERLWEAMGAASRNILDEKGGWSDAVFEGLYWKLLH